MAKNQRQNIFPGVLALLSVKRPVSCKGGERIKGGWKVAGYQYLATGWSLLFLPPYLSGDKSNKGDGRYFPYNINPLLTKVTFLTRVTFVTFLAISIHFL